MARILKIDDDSIELALETLAGGQCVAIPTETVYGLAGDATNGLAVARIFEIKGRPRFNPLICHVSDIEMGLRHGVMSALAIKLAEKFWPGPLTIVVPAIADSGISQLATAGLSTIGLRCPDSPARTLIQRFGRPLAAPSANRSGRVSPTQAQHVAEEFDGLDLLVLNGGPCRIGIESTIVKIEAERLVVLRPGSVTFGEFETACGVHAEFHASTAIEAPGMMASHYAPDSHVLTNVTDCPHRAALLAFGGAQGRDRTNAIAMQNLSPSGDLREAAANLYAMLKLLDAKKARMIAVEPVPREGLGLAINDRLERAATPREAV